MRKKCPFCENEGCCFCEHSGIVKIGVGESFEIEEQFDFMVNKILKNRENAMNGAIQAIKIARGEKITKKKTYDIDYTIEDW